MEQYLQAGVTILVGLGAFEVYRRQKRDHKKTAARIILIEIENAERKLQTLTNQEGDELVENTYLMPSASWKIYRHLFAQDFLPREWDTITNFYERCAQYDEAVRFDSMSFTQNTEAYRKSINLVLAFQASQLISGIDHSDTPEQTGASVREEYIKFRDSVTSLYMSPNNLYMYKPVKALNDAAAATESIDRTISLTSIGLKLKRIARPGLFERIFRRAD